MPIDCRRRLAGLGLALLGCAAQILPAAAQPAAELYSVTVPYAGDTQAAFREAMRDILVRVTGRPDAAELEYLAPLMAEASRYVVSFRRAAGGQLAVNFDGPAIENAVDAAGLASWGGARPLTLVWLAVDRGAGRRELVHSGASSVERAGVERGAARHGLPLVWPDAGDDLVRALQEAWSGDHASLVEAARRYGAEGVLIGRATPAAPAGPSVEWTFVSAGLSSGAVGGLEAGPGLAAQRYADRYASRSAGQRSEQVVTVTGIDSIADYARVLQMLARLPPVRGVAVDEVTPGAVSFVVNVRGDPASLSEAMVRDGRLFGVDPARMIFSIRP